METEGGYADVGRALGVDRRQVYAWFRRGSRNADGERFPRPVRTERHPVRTQARYVFSIPAAVQWHRAGMPEKNPNQHTWAGMK